MRSKKKRLFVIAVLAVLVAIAAVIFLRRDTQTVLQGNLLENGDFTALEENGLPTGWYTDAYIQTVGFTDYTAESGVATITNNGLNDARFAQRVAVQPNTLYCLSGYIRAEASGGLGANLSVSDVYVFSSSVYDSQGEWQLVRLYGRTGENQRQVTVFARLGGYSGEAIGTASFRELSLEQVQSVPAEYIAYQWYKSETASSASLNGSDEPAPAWPWLVGIALLYASACWLLMRQVMASGAPDHGRGCWLPFTLMLVLAAVARVLIAVRIPGYGVDIGCFTAWANVMARSGAVNFYNAAGFCDYPPGYILVLGALGKLGQWLGTGTTELMVKLPSIVCDLAAAAVLYAWAKKRVLQRAAFALSALYALNPLTFAAGAAWGQADSVMALCILLVVVFAMENRWYAALPAYMLAVLMKPQALMFGPLGVIALVCVLLRQRDRRLLINAGVGLLLAALLALAVILPFSPNMDNGDGWWIIGLYRSTIGYYANATVNACNLYFLFGKNWISVEQSAPFVIRLGAAVLLTGGVLFVGLRGTWWRRGKLYAVSLISTAAALASIAAIPMTYSTLGTAVILLSVLLCVCLYLQGKDIRHLPLLGAVQLILLCNLGTMMHERYLFAAVLLLALACVTERDWRVYLLFVLLTVATFLNVGVVLDRGVRIGGVSGHLDAPFFGINSDSAVLEYIVSALQCGISLLAGTVAVQICAEGKTAPVPALPQKTDETSEKPRLQSPALAELRQPQRIQPMKGQDWLLMLAVTAVYAVAALVNLGSTTSPQTWWRSTAANNSVVLDMGEVQTANLLYLGGIHSRDSDFTVRVSDDAETWSEPYWAKLTEGDCFKWQYLCEVYTYDGGRNYSTTPRVITGRYVKIEAQNIATTLYEVILRDPETQAVYPVSVYSGAGNALTDGNTETYWRSAVPNETVVLDLGSLREAQLQYYTKSVNGDKTIGVSVSEDGQNWSDPYWTESTEGDAFKWQYVTEDGTPVRLYGRYIRLEAQSVGTALYEVVLRNPVTDEVLPVSVRTGDDGAAHLIDEQDTFSGEPGWYNSTYFDEIYHARTGYEHYLAMHGDYTYRPYETSHPPLGKVLIALSISVFGMTPFGWRFAGALAGILMLPAMYLLGKLLTKRRVTAFAAAFLMAVDCMHFTQTRIATIDSFVVLFILWSMVFMVYYIRMDYWRKKLWQTLIPLGLSGLFMGLAVASKWTGCYAGVGLALLFFWSLYRRFRESLAAKASANEAQEKEESFRVRCQAAAAGIYRRPVITLLCCLIFFVAVPALIYYISYIPYFLPYSPSGVTVERVLQAAEGMLRYHSTPGLGMDHPFYSPWNEWPIIGKPMWYYSSTYRPQGGTQTIAALGNPAVWWGGLAALMTVALIWLLRHVTRQGITLHTRVNDTRPAILLIAFAAQYVPWTLVPRGTYIYHYFPSVPFIILCAALCLDLLFDRCEKPITLPPWHIKAALWYSKLFSGKADERLLQKADRQLVLRWRAVPIVLTAAYLLAALVLFIAFFPYASGITASYGWLQKMQWFRGWLYY